MNRSSVVGQAPDPLRSLSLLRVLMYVTMIFTSLIIMILFFKQTGKPYTICDSAVCKMYVSAYLKWKKGEVNVTLKQHYAKKNQAALHFGVLFDKLLMAGRSEDQSY